MRSEKAAALPVAPHIDIQEFCRAGTGIERYVIGWNLSVVQVLFDLDVVRPGWQWIDAAGSVNIRPETGRRIVMIFDGC
jgi:hypothetical protein